MNARRRKSLVKNKDRQRLVGEEMTEISVKRFLEAVFNILELRECVAKIVGGRKRRKNDIDSQLEVSGKEEQGSKMEKRLVIMFKKQQSRNCTRFELGFFLLEELLWNGKIRF